MEEDIEVEGEKKKVKVYGQYKPQKKNENEIKTDGDSSDIKMNYKEKARKYAAVLETELVSVADYCEAMDNILLAIGLCYCKEGETQEEEWEAVCDAYEAEFKRLGLQLDREQRVEKRIDSLLKIINI